MARAARQVEQIPVPEADALEGFAHPRLTSHIFGHAAAEGALADAFASGRLHHAWLITGAEGIGKATLAYRFARFLLSEKADRSEVPGNLECSVSGRGTRQVASLSHPGLLVIRRPYDLKEKRFKASITIEEVRRLRDFLGHKSGNDGWRVVIVDPVDELNTNAANALLKSLEEPPARCVFLLVTSEPGRLLPTIRSRCRRLQLNPLGNEDLERALKGAFAGAEGVESPGQQEWQRLMGLSGGSVRRFLALATKDGASLSRRIDQLFDGLNMARGAQTNWVEVHALADELGGVAALQKFETFYELLTSRISKIVKARAMNDLGGADGQLAARLINPERVASWAELWETIVRDKALVLALNLDRKAFILETVARLDQAAAR